MHFAERLKTLASVSHIQAIQLLDDKGESIGLIENKPGQTGSLAVYHHLAERYGMISIEAAQAGLELYAEHTEDARLHPGKHPNIDRLFRIIENHQPVQVERHFYS